MTTTDFVSCAFLIRVVVAVDAIVRVLNKEAAVSKETALADVFDITLLTNLTTVVAAVLVTEIFFNVLRTTVLAAALVKLRNLELPFKTVLVVVEVLDNNLVIAR